MPTNLGSILAGERWRYLEPADAAEWLTELPNSIIPVAVLLEITAIDGINCLQLHGAEPPEFCLSPIEAQITLWKAVPMIGGDMPLPVSIPIGCC